MENSFSDLELRKFSISFFIPMTVMFGSGLILLGEVTDSHFRGERLNKGKNFH